MSFALVDDKLVAHLEKRPQEREGYLFLEPHPDFKGYWKVNGFSKELVYDLHELIGSYRAVAPSGLENFLRIAGEHGYQTAFFEDPHLILNAYENLDAPPSIEIESHFEDTINGLLPFQVQGYNFLKEKEAGILRWDTGTGKTIGAAALAKYHQQQDDFDLCLFVVKRSNKVNTVRKLKKLAGIDAFYITGDVKRRNRYYAEIRDRLAKDEKVTVVINYEKFRDDFVTWKRVKDAFTGKMKMKVDGFTEWGETFFTQGHRLLCLWDEMPSKLKTRTTNLYMAVCSCLYDTDPPKVKWEKKRAPQLIQYMLSATPIENDPEDWFNCVRLLTGSRVFGTVTAFQKEYVRSFNWYNRDRPEDWHHLDKMRMTADHLVHSVDKTDPDIAKYFPKVVEDDLYIDWDDRDLKVYEKAREIARDLEDTEDELHLLSVINVLQMLCDAPEMVLDSVARREVYESALEIWKDQGGRPPDHDGSKAAVAILDRLEDLKITNAHHQKLDTLRGLLTEVHPNDKAVVFTRWSSTILPFLEEHLEKWGISYVTYTGTEKQRQEAIDNFQEDSEIRVFLSSDSGSDSIDLDAGSVVINYNLPLKWSTLVQRQNRIHRATSLYKTVWVYSLLMEGSVEDRTVTILQEKQGYHDGLFRPDAGTASASMRMTKQDLIFILTGERD